MLKYSDCQLYQFLFSIINQLHLIHQVALAKRQQGTFRSSSQLQPKPLHTVEALQNPIVSM